MRHVAGELSKLLAILLHAIKYIMKSTVQMKELRDKTQGSYIFTFSSNVCYGIHQVNEQETDIFSWLINGSQFKKMFTSILHTADIIHYNLNGMLGHWWVIRRIQLSTKLFIRIADDCTSERIYIESKFKNNHLKCICVDFVIPVQTI